MGEFQDALKAGALCCAILAVLAIIAFAVLAGHP